MSIAFLYSLTNSRNTICRRYLKSIPAEPRIAWYPSAGKDFRALMFLSAKYQLHNPAKGHEPIPPDIFIYTDYYPWSSSTFLDSLTIFQDSRTTVKVIEFDILPNIDLPLHREIVSFPEVSIATNRVIFMQVEVSSDLFGIIRYPVFYVFSENEAFCAEKLIANEVKLSHIINVRYGAGFGGSRVSAAWLVHNLECLGCEVFISDGHHTSCQGKSDIFRIYPQLQKQFDEKRLLRIRKINGASWSNHGDVSWYLVS